MGGSFVIRTPVKGLRGRKEPTAPPPYPDRNAELLEIDENLVRDGLTALERAEQLKRRKEIYEARHPEAKAGVAGANASNRKQGKGHGDASEIISFASDTASKMSVTPRSVQQDVQIAERIAAPVRAAIADTPLAVRHAALEVPCGRPRSSDGRGPTRPTRRARRDARRAGCARREGAGFF